MRPHRSGPQSCKAPNNVLPWCVPDLNGSEVGSIENASFLCSQSGANSNETVELLFAGYKRPTKAVSPAQSMCTSMLIGVADDGCFSGAFPRRDSVRVRQKQVTPDPPVVYATEG